MEAPYTMVPLAADVGPEMGSGLLGRGSESGIKAGSPHQRVNDQNGLPPKSTHPYLEGNFYPVSKEYDLVACPSTNIPHELHGGQYVRNGPNPKFPSDGNTPYHWFDGDGMLHGVYFSVDAQDGACRALYVNKFLRTDVYQVAESWGFNILPSISSLIAIGSTKVSIMRQIMRAASLYWMSGTQRLSVANTAVVFHNKKLLATCESGPPLHVMAPNLDTVNFWTFKDSQSGKGLGDHGSLTKLRLVEEWTTAHPKRDPVNGDLVFFGYNIFPPGPYAAYSVVGKDGSHKVFKAPIHLSKPKMMHDFGCSRRYAIILDLPLTMDPLNILRAGKPMVLFDRTLPSRFGLLPRLYDGRPDSAQWFESGPSMTYHTANAYDEVDEETNESLAVCLLACRFKSAKLVHAAGGLAAPAAEAAFRDDVVMLTYYRFDLSSGLISHEFPLTAIPFEFPKLNPERSMLDSRYVWGCSMKEGSFDAALAGAKINVMVKVDVRELARRGKVRNAKLSPEDIQSGMAAEPVDKRSLMEIVEANRRNPQASRLDPCDPLYEPITAIVMPPHHYCQEPTFVAKTDARTEDDGYLLSLVYDESQLLSNGDAPDGPDARGSELWIFDASTMGENKCQIIGKVNLPQRVPYGFHGLFVTKSELDSQDGATSLPQGSSNASTKATGSWRPSISRRPVLNPWKWRVIGGIQKADRGSLDKVGLPLEKALPTLGLALAICLILNWRAAIVLYHLMQGDAWSAAVSRVH